MRPITYPYALFTRCGMLYWLQRAAIVSTESHALGAKQLVVVSTQATLSPKAAI